MKILKIDDSIGSPSSLQRRPSVLKSSEEAFLTNYLDELSDDDDDDDALGDLNGGQAVYGHVESRDIQNKSEVENENDNTDILERNSTNGESSMQKNKNSLDDKHGSDNETNQSSSKPIASLIDDGSEEKDDEDAGGYEEDFDA